MDQSQPRALRKIIFCNASVGFMTMKIGNPNSLTNHAAQFWILQ